MKASELRDVLADRIQKHGDLEVYVFDILQGDGEAHEEPAEHIGVVAYAQPPHFTIRG